MKKWYLVFLWDNIDKENVWHIWVIKKIKNKKDLFSLYLYNSFFKKSLYPFWYLKNIKWRFIWLTKNIVIYDVKKDIKSYDFLKEIDIYNEIVDLYFYIMKNETSSEIIEMLKLIFGKKENELLSILYEYKEKVNNEEKKIIDIVISTEKIVNENKYIIYKEFNYIIIFVLFLKVSWYELSIYENYLNNKTIDWFYYYKQ